MAIIKIRRTTTSSTPTGLTFGEPAFVQGKNSFYITNSSSTAVRVGAEVDTDNTFTANSDDRLPTQKAVKAYVDNNLASGAVTSVEGVTGAVDLVAGSGVSITPGTHPDKSITIVNTGVTGITGTANQITANFNTGSVTLSLPSAITAPGSLTTTGNLTVGGNLIVNGTTTTVNSETVTIQDPVIVLGGTVGVDDSKDRGIQFNYNGGNTGFFGYDDSADRFIFLTTATNSSEVFSGTLGDAAFGSLYLGTGANNTRFITSTLTGNRRHIVPDWDGNLVSPSGFGSSNNIIKSNGSGTQPTWIDPTASGFTAFYGTNATNIHGGAAGSLPYQSSANATTFLSIGSANRVLTSSGSAPQWSDPTVSGFTAFAAANAQTILVNSDTSDTTCFLTFVNTASDSYQTQKYNSSLGYNASSNAITATTFIGALSGNASSATNATNSVNVISTEQTTGTFYLVGMTAAGTTGALLIDAAGATALSYAVATGTLTCAVLEALVDGGSY